MDLNLNIVLNILCKMLELYQYIFVNDGVKMNLTKAKWNKSDIKKFQKYLYDLRNETKVGWTRNILCTNLPCLAIKTPILKSIAKEIAKGDFLSFLNYNLSEYYENVAINGFLLQKITDFDIMKKYLFKYFENVECWAACDLLSFKINNENKNKFCTLSQELIKSEKTFIRRIGLVILFNKSFFK